MDKSQLISSLKAKGFSKEILNAFSKVLREDFVPQKIKIYAYEDTALPIGKGQTISQPYTIAEMLKMLELKKGQKVLEIGSGCGYVLALLSEIVGNKGEVYGIEIIKELAEKSKQNLKDYQNIKIYNKNGAEGLEEKDATLVGGNKKMGGSHAILVRGNEKSRPSMLRGESTRETRGSLVFDRILISAACTEIPKPLIQQLKNQGILVAPIGYRDSQTLTSIQKINTENKKFSVSQTPRIQGVSDNKIKIKKQIPGFIFVRFVD